MSRQIAPVWEEMFGCQIWEGREEGGDRRKGERGRERGGEKIDTENKAAGDPPRALLRIMLSFNN